MSSKAKSENPANKEIGRKKAGVCCNHPQMLPLH
jgi:hypothetical protein